MSLDFSQPWSDEGVEGLWKRGPGGASVRDEAKHNRLTQQRERNRLLCVEWREAAEADGWVFHPTYGDHEPVEHAFRGEREGFVIQGIARPERDVGRNRYGPEASIHIWGPDGLAIKPPLTYDMDAIRRGARICGYCGQESDDTRRVGFAGRVCPTCDPKVRPSIEYPGWTR